jgi:beta-N-acetylhexosaminidase
MPATFSLEHKVGQLLFIGIPGPTLDAPTQQLLNAVQPGGVILFARNLESPQQTAELTNDIRRFLRVAPLISIDQEGGRVDRLKKIIEPSPSAGAIRDTGEARFAYELGHVTADLLRLLGFNMNFAPTLDLDVTDGRANGLQDRCFGRRAMKVARLAGTYLEALQNYGILGCGKHFPGLGDTAVDSHERLPVASRSEKALMEEDLQVYSDLFNTLNARLPAVMIAHATYPAFDGATGTPASLSTNVVTDLLRKKMEFGGLAICDDLEMGAIAATRSFSDAVVQAVEAGNDMLLMCSKPELAMEAHETLVQAFAGNRFPKYRLESSINRIARLKAMATAAPNFDPSAFQRSVDRLAALNRAVQHQLAGGR